MDQKKDDSTICHLQEKYKDADRLKVKEWEKLHFFHMQILSIRNLVYFTNRKSTARSKEGHFIIIKKSIHQESITIVNVNVPNKRASKYLKQKLTEL